MVSTERLRIPEYTAAIGLDPSSWIFRPIGVRLISSATSIAARMNTKNRIGIPATVAWPRLVSVAGDPYSVRPPVHTTAIPL